MSDKPVKMFVVYDPQGNIFCVYKDEAVAITERDNIDIAAADIGETNTGYTCRPVWLSKPVDINEVQRYTLDTRHHALSGSNGDTDLWEAERGEWVKYSDVVALIAKPVDRETLREAVGCVASYCGNCRNLAETQHLPVDCEGCDFELLETKLRAMLPGKDDASGDGAEGGG